MRFRSPRHVVALPAALVCLLVFFARLASGQVSPCATVPGADSLTPVPGQPAGVYVLGAVGTQAVGVWRTDGHASVCLGRAEPQGASKKWRAVIAMQGGTVTVSNFGAVSSAVVKVWSTSTVALPPAPPVVPPTPPVVPTPTPTPVPVPVPVPVKDSAPPSAPSAGTVSLDSLGAILGAPIVRDSVAAARGRAYVVFDSLAAAWGASHWTSEGTDFNANYYDRAHGWYFLWARTGKSVWRDRASAMAVAWRDTYATPAGFNIPPHNAMLEGVYDHYRLTGDDASRYAVVKIADRMWGAYANALGAPAIVFDSAHMAKADPRIHARVLLAQLLASKVGGHPNVTPEVWGVPGTWPQRIDSVLAGLARWQRADGRLAVDFACGGANAFEHGLLAHTLIRLHTEYPLTAAQRAAVVTFVQRDAAYLWTLWHPGQGFQYGDVAACATDNGTQVTPDLTGLMLEAYGWLARVAPDATVRATAAARADEAFAQLAPGAYWTGAKQYNQATTYTGAFIGWLVGAH